MDTTFLYNPAGNKLVIKSEGKIVGGFSGAIAEKVFHNLIEKGQKVKIMSETKGEKVRKLRAIWIKLGADQHRDVILARYGVSSTKDLTEVQLDTLIAEFTALSNQRDSPKDIRVARSVVIKLLDQMGIYSPDNWESVNTYLLNPKIAGKLLYELNLEELKKLALKLRSIKGKSARNITQYSAN